MEVLTKKEETIMTVIWDIKRALVKDVIDQIPNPKPPYTTISSVVRILEKKGFVGHKAYGKTHEYFPLVTKLAYKKFALKNFLINHFDGSLEKVVSFMVKEKALSEAEVNDIWRFIQQHKSGKK